MTVATPAVYPTPGFLRLPCPSCNSTGYDRKVLGQACSSCGGSGALPMPLNPAAPCARHGLFPTITVRIEGLPCPYCFVDSDSVDALFVRERCSLIESSEIFDFSIAAGEVDRSFLLFPSKVAPTEGWPLYRVEPRETGLFASASPAASSLGALRFVDLHIRPTIWGDGVGNGAALPRTFGVALAWVETP